MIYFYFYSAALGFAFYGNNKSRDGIEIASNSALDIYTTFDFFKFQVGFKILILLFPDEMRSKMKDASDAALNGKEKLEEELYCNMNQAFCYFSSLPVILGSLYSSIVF